MTIAIKILIYLSYLFGVSELILTFLKRSKQITVKKKRDRGSLIILWIIISAGITLGFFFANFKPWRSFNYLVYSAGIIIYLIGIAIRWISIFQLNKAFTTDVAISENQKLKTDGLYGIVRHPSYLGGVMIVCGLSIGMNSLLSFLVTTLPVFLAFLYRIYVEEVVLLEEFGERYEEYRRKTKKILPYIY